MYVNDGKSIDKRLEQFSKVPLLSTTVPFILSSFSKFIVLKLLQLQNVPAFYPSISSTFEQFIVESFTQFLNGAPYIADTFSKLASISFEQPLNAPPLLFPSITVALGKLTAVRLEHP